MICWGKIDKTCSCPASVKHSFPCSIGIGKNVHLMPTKVLSEGRLPRRGCTKQALDRKRILMDEHGRGHSGSDSSIFTVLPAGRTISTTYGKRFGQAEVLH